MTAMPLAPRAKQTVVRQAAANPVQRPSLIHRAHEAALGRQTFALARALEQSQWQSPEQIRSLQEQKLAAIVEHARENCPYYRDLPPIDSLHRLQELPLITRAELRRHARRMCWTDIPFRILMDYTHGTADRRFPYFWDRTRQAWDKAHRLRAAAWHGFELSDHELHFWPLDPPRTMRARLKHGVRTLRDGALNDLQIDSLRYELADAVQQWQRFAPARLTAYPSTLVNFLRDVRDAGQSVASTSLRKIFLTGEVTFDWQREEIESELGASIAECYGVQEAGALGFECERGAWHLCAESSIVEVIRDRRPARSGELGELVVTTLESRAMPLLRYCTGDIVRAGDRSCECGRGLPVIPPILGRTSDFLTTRGGGLASPADVLASLGEILELGRFQIHQDCNGEIAVHVLNDLNPAVAHKAAALLRTLSEGFPVSVVHASNLTQSPFGKCRYVQSARTPQIARPPQFLAHATMM